MINDDCVLLLFGTKNSQELSNYLKRSWMFRFMEFSKIVIPNGHFLYELKDKAIRYIANRDSTVLIVCSAWFLLNH